MFNKLKLKCDLDHKRDRNMEDGSPYSYMKVGAQVMSGAGCWCWYSYPVPRLPIPNMWTVELCRELCDCGPRCVLCRCRCLLLVT